MADSQKDPDPVEVVLRKQRIATLEELKNALGTVGTMTVYRRLKALGYRTSYSHRGKYYTLGDTPQFDSLGIWSWHSVWFSTYGNLVATARELVEQAEAGWTTQELESILHVEVKRPLLRLCRDKAVVREKVGGLYTYFSQAQDVRRMQLLVRRQRSAEVTIGLPPQIDALSHELKAGIILFFSLLDEKQRRLYAGLEAHKMGHGGDRNIADFLGLDVHTVAKGRRELFGGDVQRGTVRRRGGGRKAVEKKRQRSSNESSS